MQKLKQKKLTKEQQKQLADFQTKQKKNIGKIFQKSDITRLDYRMKFWSALVMLATLVEVVVAASRWYNFHEASALITVIASFPVFCLAFMAYFKSNYETLQLIGKVFILFGVLDFFVEGIGGLFLIIMGAAMLSDASRALLFKKKENEGDAQRKKDEKEIKVEEKSSVDVRCLYVAPGIFSLYIIYMIVDIILGSIKNFIDGEIIGGIVPIILIGGLLSLILFGEYFSLVKKFKTANIIMALISLYCCLGVLFSFWNKFNETQNLTFSVKDTFESIIVSIILGACVWSHYMIYKFFSRQKKNS